MTATRVTRLHLELEVEAEPVAGRLFGDGEESRPFSGWLELTRAIELGLARARTAGSDEERAR